MPAPFAAPHGIARRRALLPNGWGFLGLDRGCSLFPRAAQAFGGELQARGSVTDQAQQFVPRPMLGRDCRLLATGKRLQDQEFVWRQAHRIKRHNETERSTTALVAVLM
jgi:hypothetical protein